MSDTVENNNVDHAPQKDIYSKDLTQSEYEALRRGEKLESHSDDSEENVEEKESVSDEDENIEDSDTQDDDESDSDEDDDEDSEEKDEDESPKKPKRVSGFKKRIDKLNQRISDRDREIDDLRRRLNEQSQFREKPEKVAKTQDFSDKPKKPIEENFDSYEEFEEAQNKYIEDLADWKVEKKFKEQKEAEARNEEIRTYQKKVSDHTQRINEFKKQAQDFDQVVQEGLAGTQPTLALEVAILDSKYSAEIVYELAQDPEEFDRINSLSPLQMAKEIGRIEARFENKTSETKKQVVTTKAPKPMGKVGTRGKGHARSLYDADKVSQREWEKMREEQIRKRSY